MIKGGCGFQPAGDISDANNWREIWEEPVWEPKVSPIWYQVPTCKTQLNQVHVQTIVVSSSSRDGCPKK